MQRIVIAGGGFAGLRTARLLARGLKQTTEIVLVDRNERFVFSPWLIDGLAGDFSIDEMSETYETVAKKDGFTFVRGAFVLANRNGNVLDVRTTDGSTRAIPYDALVIAPGSHIAYYGIPGAEANTHPLKSLEDLTRIHAALRKLVENARVANDAERDALMHFVVVGGGPSGVEALFALKHFVSELISETPQLKKHVRYTLLNAGSEILNGFRASMVNGSGLAMKRQGVTVLNGDPAVTVEPGTITTKSGKILKTGFVLWCAGVQPNELQIKPDVPRDAKHCMLPDASLRLGEGVFGGGDAVMCVFEGHPLARSAQVAMQQAAYLAENVILTLQGKETVPFNGSVKGAIITLGDTGYIDTPWFAIRTPLAIPLRRLFYRFRFWQMTGRWS